MRILAAAALLVLGLGLGVQLGSRPAAPLPQATAAQQEIESNVVASLARVELLEDIGVGYTQGLRSLLDRMADLDSETTSPARLEETREIARNLIRDGRLLLRNLDPSRDRTLLAAVHRAELVLEEIAAVGSSGLGAPKSSIQLAVHDRELRERLTSINIESLKGSTAGRSQRAVASRPVGEGTAP